MTYSQAAEKIGIGPSIRVSRRGPSGHGIRLGKVVFVFGSLLLGGFSWGGSVVTHHDLAVRLDPKTHTLTGVDILTVRPDGEATIALALSEDAFVEKVFSQGRVLPFSFAAGSLRIALPPETSGKEEIPLTVAYRIPFRDRVPEDPLNTDDPGYGVRGTIRERGTFLSDAAAWYPGIPGSIFTFRLRVEGPEGYEAVTAGTLARRETAGGITRSEWEGREPLDAISLSAGPYRVREGASGETKLYTFFYPESEALSEKYLSAVDRYLDLYRGIFGPYPFGKFAVVENFLPTGYGFPSYTLLGSTVLRLPFLLETSLGHEVAHSWWGNGVRVDSARGNWSEGLTTYVADHLYKERASPREGRDYRQKILRDFRTLVPAEEDLPLASFTGRDSPASRAIGYGKGAMVFHMARRIAGEEAFWKGLRHVAREKLFREASWEDFGKAFQRESGIDFSPFFRQWVYRPGAPVLALKEVTAEQAGTGWRVSGKIVQEEPFYDLRIPLRLIAEGKSLDAVLHLAAGEVPFAFSTDTMPRKLVVDPETDLFRRLDSSEIPPTVNGIRGSTNLLVVAARGLPDDVREASKLLLAAIGKEKIPILREEETPRSRIAGHDVLYLGLPQEKGYLPPLPGELALSAGGFTIEGKAYEAPGDSLFVALPHPSDGGRVAALFLSRSPDAASLAARKIPHYGKYSYLVFSQGTNRAKGIWPPGSSPTVHEFPPAGTSR
ncbi:MAG TPA: M1 family aminopeptidase [Candidatus Deferrimicrobiaceae bacterium]|nr:M1 family aminopeptidase [Candidatus Deferrimicrobiaceae bacterium]